MSASSASTSSTSTINEPFSFSQLVDAQENAPAPQKTTSVTATDGVPLAVRSYLPADCGGANDTDRPSTPKAILVFLHGGGAHSGAGYHLLARQLSREFHMVVHTPDIRGHGDSGGDRGDSPSVEQVWKDVRTVLEYAQTQNPTLPLFLGGHSSGGGLVIKYASWPEKKQQQSGENDKSKKLPKIGGYLLLSPQLGYKSNTARPSDPNRPEFASVNILAFIANGIFGWMGHSKAVRFNYPESVLTNDPGMVPFNTVYMANAITPESPAEQVQQMQEMLPLGLWVGEDDEVFLPDKVAAFGEHGGGTVVPKQTHLGILVNAHKLLGPWILNHLT